MTTTLPLHLDEKFTARAPTVASSVFASITGASSITASYISASTISSMNISKKGLFLSRLAILKEQVPLVVIFRKKKLRGILKKLKVLIEECQKATSFEGQSEVLLILSVYEVKLKKMIGS